jgi:ABC-type glycerol-3-phosphate transport system permease component
MIKVSLIQPKELLQNPPSFLPHSLTLSHYTAIFHNSAFVHGLLNSVIIAGSTTLIVLALGVPAGYAFARLRFRLRTTIMTGVLAISFFPMVAILAPLFVEYRTLGLLNSYIGVIIADTVFVLPLSVWIIATFFRQLPRELEYAAKVDGASTIQTLRLVVAPLAAPGIVTAAILTFITAWNEYLFANTFLLDQSKWPVTVQVPELVANQFTPDYGAQAAAALVVTVPIVVLVLLFQRRIVSGLTAGAVSG